MNNVYVKEVKRALFAFSVLSLATTHTVNAGESSTKDVEATQESKAVLVGGGSGAVFGAVIAGPVGAAVGGFIGMLIGNDHAQKEEIDHMTLALNQSNTQLQTEKQALWAANKKIKDYKLALEKADESVKQAKLSELMTQIQFKTGDATISPVFHAHLDNIVQVMNEDPSLKLAINGYADSRGEEQYNLGLSQQRAQNIYQYMVNAGVAKQRMTRSGYGESVSNGADFEEHFFDRKVVMTLSSEPKTMTVKR